MKKLKNTTNIHKKNIFHYKFIKKIQNRLQIRKIISLQGNNKTYQ